ncbi:MAG: DJ-1/PfpI family protein [Spirochaetaceae bacterium]|jgi:4-methyl-5(b-hydroxyethyl)-thiazole monophosphate biosynthesis|nr:DJ-1/PfpI family protein [Spirochaetaceae bacterium]
MGKKALVFLAEGFEEVEAVTPIDYLRRAGIEVTVASIKNDRTVRGAHGISLAADTTIAELETSGRFSAAVWDAVFVPGGMPGAANLAACVPAGNFYREMTASGKITAAICASPAVFLAPLGLLEGKKFTCYPGDEKQTSGGTWSAGRVVVDGNLITSRGPGTAAAFALALIEKLAGKEEVQKLTVAALLEIPG